MIFLNSKGRIVTLTIEISTKVNILIYKISLVSGICLQL